MDIRIRVGEFKIDAEIRGAVESGPESRRVSEGKEMHAFESSFANYVGTKHAVAVNSGTSALLAGLSAIKSLTRSKKATIPKVITSPLTYIATANSVVLTGMKDLEFKIEPQGSKIIYVGDDL